MSENFFILMLLIIISKGSVLKMDNVLKLKKNYGIWFLLGLALAFILLSIDSKIEAASKNKDTESNICGEHLNLVWSKDIFPLSSPKIKSSLISMQVLPSDENHVVHTVIWKGGESSDVPADIITFVLDPNGNKLWRGDYIDLPFIAHGGVFSVGKNTYRHFYSGNLRYHVWLDEKAVIQWVHAQRVISPLYLYRGEEYEEKVDVVDEVVYHVLVNCKNRSCQIDRLSISGKGIDPKGWQTILRWTYSEGNSGNVRYYPLSMSNSHLLVYKKEPQDQEKVEFHLIQFFISGNGKIEYDSKYYFPRKSEKAFMKNRDGSFIFFVAQEKKGTFTQLDKTGKKIQETNYNLPHKFLFSINSMKTFTNGLLVIGIVEEQKGRDILRRLAIMRLSLDGYPLWFQVYDKNDLEYAGMDSKNVFFSRQGTLYKCGEKRN